MPNRRPCLYPQCGRNFFDGERRRQCPVRHGFLDRRNPRLHPGVSLEAQMESILEHRPHPFDLLLAPARREQQVKWMWSMLEDRFHLRLKTDARMKARVPAIEKAVADGTLSPALAVEEIATALGV